MPDTDDDLQDVREAVGLRARRRIEPLMASIDQDQEFSHEVWRELRELRELGELGIFALPFPDE